MSRRERIAYRNLAAVSALSERDEMRATVAGKHFGAMFIALYQSQRLPDSDSDRKLLARGMGFTAGSVEAVRPREAADLLARLKAAGLPAKYRPDWESGAALGRAHPVTEADIAEGAALRRSGAVSPWLR